MPRKSRGARRSRGALTFTSFLYLHSNNYCLRDKTKHEERQRKIVERLKPKVSGSIPLLCIGFQLHNFSLSDLSIRKEFTKPVYFNGSQFFGKADFNHLNFKKEVNFDSANFQEVSFNVANFQGRAFFRANFQRDAYFITTNFQETADFQLFAIWMMVGSPLRITSPPKTRR